MLAGGVIISDENAEQLECILEKYFIFNDVKLVWDFNTLPIDLYLFLKFVLIFYKF